MEHLLDCDVVLDKERPRKLKAADIIIVCPYNAQAVMVRQDGFLHTMKAHESTLLFCGDCGIAAVVAPAAVAVRVVAIVVIVVGAIIAMRQCFFCSESITLALQVSPSSLFQWRSEKRSCWFGGLVPGPTGCCCNHIARCQFWVWWTTALCVGPQTDQRCVARFG